MMNKFPYDEKWHYVTIISPELIIARLPIKSIAKTGKINYDFQFRKMMLAMVKVIKSYGHKSTRQNPDPILYGVESLPQGYTYSEEWITQDNPR